MIYNLYSVKDLKNGYLQPTHDTNDESAKRNFALACKLNRNSTFFEFPEDYQLWCVGSFDTETGTIIPDSRFVMDAPQYKLFEKEKEEDVQNDIG